MAWRCGHGSKPMGSHFGVGAPLILVYVGWDWRCSLGIQDFDPWPCVGTLQKVFYPLAAVLASDIQHSPASLAKFPNMEALAAVPAPVSAVSAEMKRLEKDWTQFVAASIPFLHGCGSTPMVPFWQVHHPILVYSVVGLGC